MIQITPQMRILLAVDAVDFRKGIDTLAQVCRQQLESDPFSGSVFVFRNKRGTGLKLLLYDGQGFWLAQKRFSSGRLVWWPKAAGHRIRRLQVHEMQTLLWNGNPEATVTAPMWRRVSPKRS
jgi:transposase